MILPLLLACAATPERADPTAATQAGPPRLPVPKLADVACAASECRVLADGTVRTLPDLAVVGVAGAFAGADTLRYTTAWEVEGPCETGRCARALGPDGAPGASTPVPSSTVALEDEPLPLDVAAGTFTAAWNRGLREGWRSGFHRVVVGPGEGRITWLRGRDGAGQLVRAGSGSRTVRLGAATSPVSWPGWLAMHPTGVEAYLVAWPAPVVRAFDPSTLEVRWTLPLDGPAHGLFVDPGGRWLVVAVGPDGTERFVDWPAPRPDPDAPADPHRDELLRELDRPPVDAVLVIDLATQAIVARAQGRYRRFLPLERPVLATDREVVFLVPGALPS